MQRKPERFKSFDRVEADWNQFLSYDNTVLLPVCLTLRERRMLQLVAQYLRHDLTFRNAPEKQDRVAATDSILERLEMDNCVRIRQSPDSSCEFQISYDGGATWQLMFDMSLCMANNPTSIVEQEMIYQDILQPILEDYDPTGDITDPFPELEYGVGNDDDIDLAICFAMKAFIDGMADMAIEKIEREAGVFSLLGIVAAIVAGVAGFLVGGVLGATLAFTAMAKLVT